MDDEQVLVRIAELERRLDWLYRATGYGTAAYPAAVVPGGDSVSGEVQDLVRQGRKIEAIKVYRDQTGVGLKQAKDAVDRIAEYGI